MKHLKLYCLMLVPLLNSCVPMQENYYSPPPRVQVEQNYPPPQNYHYHQAPPRYYNHSRQVYRPSSGGTYHGHSESNSTVVTVNPEPIRGTQEQNNVHEHGSSNVHGHS